FKPEAFVLRMECGESIGSGFFVREGLVVTNAHVVGASTRCALVRDGRNESSDVVYSDTERDVAVLRTKVAGVWLPPLSQRPRIGDAGSAWGFPQGRNELAASTGTIRGLKYGFVIHDALIAAGNSGGPLVDGTGHVVGMNTLLFKLPGDRLN